MAVAFIFSAIFYLALTAGSGNLGFWSAEELVFAVIFSALTALLATRLFDAVDIKPSAKALNLKRILLYVFFACGPLFIAMAKANLDVAYRAITGKIKPGIVKVPSGLKTDFGVMMLANGITLTPGTLTVDVDKQGNLFVHWIWVEDKQPKPEQVYGSFSKWVRRITE